MQRNHEKNRNELLVVRCQLGEAAAFDDLVECWHGRLWSYIRRLTGDDEAASEAIQETWLRVLRGLPRLRDAGRFPAWMHRIARNVVMDRLRFDYARPLTSELDPEDLPALSELAGLDADLDLLRHDLLRHSLMALPLIERDVLTLFYVQELSLIETSEVLEIPVGTVKSRLFRARRLLREAMHEVIEGADQ